MSEESLLSPSPSPTIVARVTDLLCQNVFPVPERQIDAKKLRDFIQIVPNSDSSVISLSGIRLERGNSRVLVSFKFNPETGRMRIGIALSTDAGDVIPQNVNLEYLRWTVLLTHHIGEYTCVELFKMLFIAIKTGDYNLVSPILNQPIIKYAYDARSDRLYMFFSDDYIRDILGNPLPLNALLNPLSSFDMMPLIYYNGTHNIPSALRYKDPWMG